MLYKSSTGEERTIKNPLMEGHKNPQYEYQVYSDTEICQAVY